MHNPMSTNGFAFVEYASPEPKVMEQLFTSLGFKLVGKHKKHNISYFRQNDIRFFLNSEPNSYASEFTEQHGPCACSMGFRVKDPQDAFKRALELEAKPYAGPSLISEAIPAIYGIGDSLLYLVDDAKLDEILATEFDLTTANVPKGYGLECIDHLTHNVYQGNMDNWADYYERLFNFREIRFFDIQGQQTGLVSRALASPCDLIKIPLNESKDDTSQIAEYLKEYKGEGIQHIALSTDNIYHTVETIKQQNVDFMLTPDTYYELIDNRLPEHNEDVPRMQQSGILIDGGEAQGGGLLLQIFTQTVIGPIFFEIIQRKGNEGFGEGNFQALFDSIELDQIRRGVLKAKEA